MRTVQLILAILTVSFTWSSTSYGNNEQQGNNYHITQQYGANQGLYAIGLGYKKYNGFEPSMSFGYTPSYKNTISVTQLNFKFNWRAWQLKKNKDSLQWLMGFSLFMNNSPNTYFKVPKHYPNKYYPPNAYFFGLQTTLRHHNFFVELSMLDYYFEVVARNSPGTMRSGDLLSLGFGYVKDIDFQWSDIGRWVSRTRDRLR